MDIGPSRGRLTKTLGFLSVKIAFIGAFWSLSGLAYGPCDEDEEKLCGNVGHNETVKACLHKKIDQLSADCRAFVKSRDQEWKKIEGSWSQVKEACDQEIKAHCADVLKDQDGKMKALQVCLMSEKKSLESKCKKDLNRHIREFQPGIKEIP